MLKVNITALVVASAISSCCCGSKPTTSLVADAQGAPARDTPRSVAGEGTRDSTGAVTRTEMRRVDFHVSRGVALRIREPHGEMRSVTPGAPVFFDDPRSFVMRLEFAEVALTTDDLASLMNDHVFGYRGSPLRGLRFSTVGSQLKQSGTLIKGVEIPFSMLASVSVTPEGWIRIHPNDVRIFGVDGDRLMRALHIDLSKLLDVSGAQGVRVDKNDLLLDPGKILPPPSIEGRLTAIRVEEGRLVQTFGDSSRTVSLNGTLPADTAGHNFMAFRGGTLRFGKLLMLDADMVINDEDPSDSFDFSIEQYHAQLVAGYSKNQPDLGLDVFMPDLNDITRRTVTRRR